MLNVYFWQIIKGHIFIFTKTWVYTFNDWELIFPWSIIDNLLLFLRRIISIFSVGKLLLNNLTFLNYVVLIRWKILLNIYFIDMLFLRNNYSIYARAGWQVLLRAPFAIKMRLPQRKNPAHILIDILHVSHMIDSFYQLLLLLKSSIPHHDWLEIVLILVLKFSLGFL